MADILSSDEIDQLLNAISGGDIEPEEYPPDQKKVKIYDFKRPEKFSKDQIRQIQMIHETFARLVTTALSAKLRSILGIHVSSVDHLTCEEFLRSIPNPTALGVIHLDFLQETGQEQGYGSALLEIDPAITFTIIDRIFGGAGEHYKINRELTDIEISVMEEIISDFLANLKEAWSRVINLRPRLKKIETNPNYAWIVSANEMVVLITLEAKIGESEGMINLAFPADLLEAMLENPDTASQKEEHPEFTENLLINLQHSFSTEGMSLHELVKLKPGDLILLSENFSRPLYDTKVKMGEQNG
jgi:flagellar motor switch protein FliM